MVANRSSHFIAGPRVSNLKSVFSTCLKNVVLIVSWMKINLFCTVIYIKKLLFMLDNSFLSSLTANVP